jgi:hypothetical protein
VKPMLVIWKDPKGTTGWYSEEDILNEKVGLCYRICFLYKENEENYYFVAGKANDNDYEDVNIMPKSNVIGMVEIKLNNKTIKAINEINKNDTTLDILKNILK